jgi:hypothetical protein
MVILLCCAGMIDNGGIAAAMDYPYLMADGWCKANTTQVAVSPVDYQVFLGVTERAMRHALANVGPVAVAFDASHPSIVFYSSGEDGVWAITSPTSPICSPPPPHSITFAGMSLHWGWRAYYLTALYGGSPAGPTSTRWGMPSLQASGPEVVTGFGVQWGWDGP